MSIKMHVYLKGAYKMAGQHIYSFLCRLTDELQSLVLHRTVDKILPLTVRCGITYDVTPEPIPCHLTEAPDLIGESSVYILRARSLRGEYFTFTLPIERSLKDNDEIH